MLGKKTALGVSVVLALSTWCGNAMAQENKLNVDVQVGPAKIAVNADGKPVLNNPQRGIAHRASEIHGMVVKNEAGKELGTVRDVVVNVRTGQVRYAAISYGGFLGFENKLFAVPWYAFERNYDVSSAKHTLLLNVDVELLKKAPGFDKNNWPNFGDEQFADELEKHYGKFRRAGDRSLDIKAGPVEVSILRTRNLDKASADVAKRTSVIIGMTVMNKSDSELGTINDLMIDMDLGQIRYAALSFGGHFGFGNKLFAIPWSSFEYQQRESSNKNYLVLATDDATLRKAPGFDKSKWPNLADPKFSDEVDAHFSISAKK